MWYNISMRKIDLGELVNKNYSRDEVIEWLATTLGELTVSLASATNKGDLGTVGICAAQVSQCALVAKALNQKVNGKKEAVVL